MTKVLLVEDNEDNARALSRLLTRRGYVVSLAATATEALTKAGENLPEVVLMDIGLPDMDGLEATRRLKANPETAAIPVIALTAHAMAEDRSAALNAGCVDFASKPVDLTVLIGKIKALVGAVPAASGGGA